MAIDSANNPHGLLDVTPQQAGWDATVQTDFEKLAAQASVHAGNAKVAEGNANGEFESLTPLQYPMFTVATLPSAAPAGRQIYVSDESGGAVMAFSDGTNWRRMTDRAIVS